jgi:hypothetical protein
MITEYNIKWANRYCREDYRTIRGYDDAVKSPHRSSIHHINELTFTSDELKKMNMYYNRPASELVWLSVYDHANLHRKFGKSNNRWVGDDVKPGGLYRRALRLFKKGKLSESELQKYRDKWTEYAKAKRRNK